MNVADFDNHHKQRYQMICDSVQMAICHAVEGDIAEFGVATGISLEVIAATMAKLDIVSGRLQLPLKRLHAFDSFEGLPPATLPGDIDSPLVTSGTWGPGKCITAGLGPISKMIGDQLPLDRVEFYAGWFVETLPLLPQSAKFALVHLDCDLYESSLQVLTDLFENKRFSDGCILLCDDFLCNRGSGKFGQRKAWEECVAKYKPDLTDLGFYGLASWRCIIHVNN